MLYSIYSFEAAIPGWIHPDPFRTWQLSSRGPHQYWARRLPGNVWCCFFFVSSSNFFFHFSLDHFNAKDEMNQGGQFKGGK